MAPRKRWPARNTDELARYVARQFPELTRRQVLAVINATMHAVRESLGDQVAEGVERPAVKIRHAGVFELRQYKPTRRPHLNGTVRMIPARWRVAFRPADLWNVVMKRWPTRQTAQEAPTKASQETSVWSPPSDEEAWSPEVPDV